MANWFTGVTPGAVADQRLRHAPERWREQHRRHPSQAEHQQPPTSCAAYLVSEITESFMDGQNKGWGFLPGVTNEESCGEALSLFLTQQFALGQGFPNPYTGFTANTANGWLNSSLPADAIPPRPASSPIRRTSRPTSGRASTT